MARSTKSATFAAALLLLLVASAAAFDYKDALDKSLLFFEAQRSGKLPDDQRVKWRGDSGLTDGFEQWVNLVGGYYDSGDHVKFGLPMAFAVTMLSWSVIEFEQELTTSNQLKYTLDAIRWGTDYFIKAHREPNVLWVQVGDGDSDHMCWERAEEMSTPRTAFRLSPGNPGSEVAGETAAAFAAASRAFRPYDSFYSQMLLLHAKQLFTFADTFRGRYDDTVQSVKKFYPSSSGYNDELLWAAAWLFQATNDQYYLNYVSENAVAFGGTGWGVTEFSWDNKYAGLQVLLTKVLLQGGSESFDGILKQYQAKAEFFLCACLQKNNGHNVKMTPGGLLHFDDWNNLQYVGSAAFLMAVYSDYLVPTNAHLNCPDGQVQPSDVIKFIQSQADYILGKNPKSMSYLVGYGGNFPTHVHHRGASIPSIFNLTSKVCCVGGFEQWYNNPNADPNVILGALVGGPDVNDEFIDSRENYKQTEPTLVGNAPFVGVFARLGCLSGSSGGAPPSNQSSESPPKGDAIEFVHSISNTWKVDGTDYYRHVVTGKNICGKPITYIKLHIENLSGPIWGLTAAAEKDIYEFPSWITVLNPDSQFTIVYIQGGPQAKVSVVAYH